MISFIGSRKRQRELEVEHEDIILVPQVLSETYHRNGIAPYRLRRVRACWREGENDGSACIALREEPIGNDGFFNASAFPALSFFFSPVIVSSDGHDTLSLQLACNDTACDRLLAGYTNSACPVHGPFSCSCAPMCRVSQLARLLAAELTLISVPDATNTIEPLPVIFNEYGCPTASMPTTSCIFVDSLRNRWSCVIVTVPLPPRVFGPVPLRQMDCPVSRIPLSLTACMAAGADDNALDTVRNCSHCGVARTVSGLADSSIAQIDSGCTICSTYVCRACMQWCSSCGRCVCHACCNPTDEGGSFCLWCLM